MPSFTASDGTEIAFQDQGEGLPLLCLAGLTRTGQDFDYVLPYLNGCRVIRPDYRGRGASAWSGFETYTVPQEAADQLELLDHLKLERVAILGTSRGGLIGLGLAAAHKDRLLGLCLNDVGPVIERAGLERIFDYVGHNPTPSTHAELAAVLPAASPGFANVPAERWLAEAKKHYNETADGLEITYDPALRQAFLAAFDTPLPDLWPLFDTLADLPVGLIRGANSDLLSKETAKEMATRRPDLITAEVPDRAHIPFLDEPEAIDAIQTFIKACSA